MMKFGKTIALVASAMLASTAAFADDHEGDKKDKMNAGDAPTMGWFPTTGWTPWGWGKVNPLLGLGNGYFTAWSLFDPYLLDIPGGDGKGMAVYSADDPNKIIGYLKMPAPQKPKGPVHCMIKETGLLAKSVDDCEAAGGTVAK